MNEASPAPDYAYYEYIMWMNPPPPDYAYYTYTIWMKQFPNFLKILLKVRHTKNHTSK